MNPKCYVVTGAKGFIGRHFVDAALAAGHSVRALTRGVPAIDGSRPIDWVHGDLAESDVWPKLILPGSVVINLAFSQVSATSDAIAATRAMIKACAQVGASRIIHCSTISVLGRSGTGIVDETTPCNPIDDYGRQKLAVESALLDTDPGRCQVSILRPAAVFGDGGQALQTLAGSLRKGNRLANYARASLFGQRQMHLVPVEWVVAALLFLAETRALVDREVFIVSADDEPLNNFRDVESRLLAALHLSPYSVPLIPLPRGLLRLMLRLRGRSEVDPGCRYSSAKLRRLGFVPPVSFEMALHAQLVRLSGSK